MSGVKAERYAAYKDSGMEWIEEVPEHWAEVRIKDLAFLERGKFTHRPRNDPQMYDGPHPFIQTGDVARANKYVTTYKQTLSDKGTEVSRKFKSGTLLMAIAANIGDVAIVNFDTYFPDSVVGFTPIKSSTDYLFYLLTATRNELNRVKITSTQDNLNLERLNSLVKFLPPLPEQIAIAAYLDSKTTQIDRKIDLLSQKVTQYDKLKQSLINKTVTRGLDKTVPMKESEIDWLRSEIPLSWDVARIKDLAFLQSGSSIISEQIDREGDYPVYGGNGLRGFYFDYTNDGNYILIGRQGALCGNVNYAKGKFWASEHAVVVYLKRHVNMKWFGELLKVMNLNQYSLAAAQPGLAMDRIKRLMLPLPPLAEQTAIATYLDEKTTQIDRITTTINNQINKLKELRKALINDVVTGKIKVVSEEQTP